MDLRDFILSKIWKLGRKGDKVFLARKNTKKNEIVSWRGTRKAQIYKDKQSHSYTSNPEGMKEFRQGGKRSETPANHNPNGESQMGDRKTTEM